MLLLQGGKGVPDSVDRSSEVLEVLVDLFECLSYLMVGFFCLVAVGCQVLYRVGMRGRYLTV